METSEVCAFVRKRVGATITRLSVERGISQSQLAAMVSINRSYLNQIAGGKGNASLDMLVKIADGLDVPVTDLFVGMEGKPPRELPSYDGTDLTPSTDSPAGTDATD